jgi:hypothetical protein
MSEIIEKLIRKVYSVAIPKSGVTSLSDNQAYPQACLRASSDYRAFNSFRRNPIYNQILEHVSQSQGESYLSAIKNDGELMAHLDEFKKNDVCGKPRLYEYPPYGMISPTTLRYVKVLKDLKDQIGSLDGLNIAEIGVGYGGQCRVTCSHYQPSSYTLIDIQPALSLTQRYLDHFPLKTAVSYKTMNELSQAPYDLVISNYAFTELPRSIQEIYLKKVILNSKKGYITYNDINPDHFNSYTREELLSLLPQARVIDEVPLTHPQNCIILWS